MTLTDTRVTPQSSSVSAGAFSVALLADAASLVTARVLGIVSVALWAMRFLTITPAKLLSWGTAAIRGVSHGLHVSRVHAITNTAQVVDLQSFGDGADAELVRPAVRRGFSSTAVRTASYTERAISTRITGASPKPALIEFDFRPETQGYGDSLFHSRKGTTPPTQHAQLSPYIQSPPAGGYGKGN